MKQDDFNKCLSAVIESRNILRSAGSGPAVTAAQVSRLLQLNSVADAALATVDVAPNPFVYVREVPPCFDACKRLWDAAQNEPPVRTIFDLWDFVGGENMTNDPVPRMTPDAQDRMEAAVMALGKSEWGQEWLAHDENAASIDRKYCFQFVGYWVARTHPHNPDLGFTRYTTAP